MKAHVWYGPNGAILAVGSIQEYASLTVGSTDEAVKVIEADVASEAELANLHETHRVDVDIGKLVAR